MPEGQIPSLRASDIQPMRAPDRNYRPFTDPEWLYEIKVDGWRCRAGFGAGQPVEMFTKSGAACASWFPEVAEVLAQLPGGPWVVDGELAVLDSVGRSDFDRMQARALKRRWVPGAQVTLMAFDLMVAEGVSVMDLPLVERKQLLAKALSTAGKTTVMYQGDFPAQADLVAQIVVPLDLEGFMAKRKASPYRPGERSEDWRKVKPPGMVQRLRQRFAGRRRR